MALSLSGYWSPEKRYMTVEPTLQPLVWRRREAKLVRRLRYQKHAQMPTSRWRSTKAMAEWAESGSTQHLNFLEAVDDSAL